MLGCYSILLAIFTIFAGCIFRKCNVKKGDDGITLEAVYSYLNMKFPQHEDIDYTVPSQNFLQQGWLVQTPNAWETEISEYNKSFIPRAGHAVDKEFGVPTCMVQEDCGGVSVCKAVPYAQNKLCLTKAYDIMEKVYWHIVSAKTSVDIVTLSTSEGKFTSGAFTALLRNALTDLSYKSEQYSAPVTVRILGGTAINIIDTRKYLTQLTSAFSANNKVVISVAHMRSCAGRSDCNSDASQKDPLLSFTWNHGKIINTDSKFLLTGGENLWGSDYLGPNPVNDSNIEISGPVANGATSYANILWRYVSGQKNPVNVNYCFTYKDGHIKHTCPSDIPYNMQHIKGKNDNMHIGVKSMVVAKLTRDVVAEEKNSSEIARIFAIRNAERSVKISQQSIFYHDVITRKILHPTMTVAGNLIQAMAQAIYKNDVDVYIVVSTHNHTRGYSSATDLQYIRDSITNAIVDDYKISQSVAAEKVQKHLNLGYLSYGSGHNSPGRAHNKFWMIDDKIFYLGGHNFYPSSLQQFGVIVESEAAARVLLQDFWDPMWNNSIKQ